MSALRWQFGAPTGDIEHDRARDPDECNRLDLRARALGAGTGSAAAQTQRHGIYYQLTSGSLNDTVLLQQPRFCF